MKQLFDWRHHVFFQKPFNNRSLAYSVWEAHNQPFLRFAVVSPKPGFDAVGLVLTDNSSMNDSIIQWFIGWTFYFGNKPGILSTLLVYDTIQWIWINRTTEEWLCFEVISICISCANYSILDHVHYKPNKHFIQFHTILSNALRIKRYSNHFLNSEVSPNISSCGKNLDSQLVNSSAVKSNTNARMVDDLSDSLIHCHHWEIE